MEHRVYFCPLPTAHRSLPASPPLPHPAPIPPLPLFKRQIRILHLSYRGDKRIQATRIDHSSSDTAQLSIHPLRISLFELCDAMDSEQLEIFQHRGTD